MATSESVNACCALPVLRYSSEFYPQFVAVKILTAAATNAIRADRAFEQINLQKVALNMNSGHKGVIHCPIILSYFLEESQHGQHLCIVTLVNGSHLLCLRDACTPPHRTPILPIRMVKRVVKQTLLAADFLHTVCSIVHGGKRYPDYGGCAY